MKHSKILLLLPGLAALSLSSCVVPGPGYGDPGIVSNVGIGVGYGVYDTLPSYYVGDAYYYGGRYYSGGRYEHGNYRDNGHVYTTRYQHNGQYFYGGRQEHHNGGGGAYHNGNPPHYGDHSGTTGGSWQQNDSSGDYNPRRTR